MRLLFAVAFAMAVSAAPPDGAAVFESHCATCHQTETGSRTPTRAELGNLTPEQVMNALLRGKMTMQGARWPLVKSARWRCMLRVKTSPAPPSIQPRGDAPATQNFRPALAIGTDGA